MMKNRRDSSKIKDINRFMIDFHQIYFKDFKKIF